MTQNLQTNSMERGAMEDKEPDLINFRQPLSEQLNVRVDKNTLDSLDGIAGKEGVDRVEVIRTFIQLGIKKWCENYLKD